MTKQTQIQTSQPQTKEEEATTIKNYLQLLKDRKLCAAECTSCHNLMLPPRLVCPNCGGTKTRWKQLSGRGTLRAFTVIHVAPTTHAQEAPYIVAVVQLEEGPSITARLLDVDPLKPEELHVGIPLTADFKEIPGPTPEETTTHLVFRPTQTSPSNGG